MLLGWADADGIRAALEAADQSNPRWAELARLAEGRWAEFDRLSRHIRRVGSDHSRVGDVAGIAAFFDDACALSPEAGVALYSLGDPAILEASTTEMVRWLQQAGLLPPAAAALDIGCGIGRVCAALAPLCRRVVGIDVAPAMVAEARRRHPWLEVLISDGHRLPPGPWDLVLLADTMPYVLQAGLADATVASAMDSLAPKGALAILNLSYGRDPAADLQDVARWGAQHGASVTGSRPFTLWDGTAFVLRRP